MNVPTRINVILFVLLFVRCMVMHWGLDGGPDSWIAGFLAFSVVMAPIYFAIATILRWAFTGRFQVFTFKF